MASEIGRGVAYRCQEVGWGLHIVIKKWGGELHIVIKKWGGGLHIVIFSCISLTHNLPHLSASRVLRTSCSKYKISNFSIFFPVIQTNKACVSGNERYRNYTEFQKSSLRRLIVDYWLITERGVGDDAYN